MEAAFRASWETMSAPQLFPFFQRTLTAGMVKGLHRVILQSRASRPSIVLTPADTRRMLCCPVLFCDLFHSFFFHDRCSLQLASLAGCIPRWSV